MGDGLVKYITESGARVFRTRGYTRRKIMQLVLISGMWQMCAHNIIIYIMWTDYIYIWTNNIHNGTYVYSTPFIWRITFFLHQRP